MNIEFSSFDYQKDLKQQRKLFVDCFPENIGTKVVEDEHYFWKFQSYPYKRKSYEYIARIDNDMAGYYAAIPYRYNIGKQKFHIGMVCDVMTNSQYRGQGVFTKLGRHSLNEMRNIGVPFTMGYPIRKEVIPGHLKVGWKIAFKQPLYIRFLSTKSLLRAKGIGYLYLIIDLFISIYIYIVRQADSKEICIQTHDNIDEVEGYQPFQKRWAESLPNTLDKSLEFMRWRFGAPDKKYHFITAYEGDKLVGLAIIRDVIKENVPAIGIVDFIVLPSHKKCIPNIHNKILKMAKEQKKEAIMTMMSRTSATNYKMYSNGFLKSPFIFSVIINKLDDTINDEILFNEKNWHLMFIDSDDL